MSDVSSVIAEYIGGELLGGEASVNEEDNLLVSGLVDSMGMMRLVAFLQERFQIEIPPEDVTIENFMSIATMDEYIAHRRSP